MAEIKTDICVIGAGSGGLSVAAGAAQMGASTVLIERGAMGRLPQLRLRPVQIHARRRKSRGYDPPRRPLRRQRA